MIRFLQINLHRSSSAQSLLQQTAAQRGSQVLLVSEQNWSPTQNDRWVCSTDRTCAVILTPTADLAIEDRGSGRGFAWIQSRGTRVYSCYNSRNDSEPNFATFLADLEFSVRSAGPRTQIVIGGDFNAWSQEWGSVTNDLRGERIVDLAASLDLSVGNTGNAVTYRRANSESMIDLTFYRVHAPNEITGWRVLENVESASDHYYVEFQLGRLQAEAPTTRHQTGWAYRRIDPEALKAHLETAPLPSPEQFETPTLASEALVNYITIACNACMPPRTPPPRTKRQVHWWNENIATLRQETNVQRRNTQRSARRPGHQQQTEEFRQAYRQKRNELRTAIRQAQIKSWADLCSAVDADPWGLPYRVVTKKIGRRPPGLEARGREEAVADHLFPNLPATQWPRGPTAQSEEEPGIDITLPELQEASARLPAGKATGPDGIPNEVLRTVVKQKPDLVLNAFNTCMKQCTFPDRWKTARLVLLHKGPEKPIADPASFRPLCMLDSAGKLLERVILKRLNDHLDATGQRSQNQYGFRRGSSTVDAIERVLQAAHGAALGATQHRDICVVVSVDVSNAFNTVPWPKIDEALQRRNCPQYLLRIIRSYLEDRNVLVGDSLRRRSVTCGVPQGSVIGPALWNVFYDDLLDRDMPAGVQMVAFADDVAIIGIARTGDQATELMNPALESVAEWMRDNGLRLAPSKTEAIVLTKKKVFTTPKLTVEGHPVTVRRHMRYLGVELDTRLSFTQHIASASKKATSAALAISRLMPNIGGPSASKRALLGSVVNSKLLYASSVWAAGGVKTAKNRAALARAQRTVALRAIRAYRTTSLEATLALAGSIPVDLLAHERSRIRRRTEDPGNNDTRQAIKTSERDITLNCWQRNWSQGNKAEWTRTIIPDLRRWLDRPKKNGTYHMTQFLTGHGCFQQYLHRIGKTPSAECLLCGHPTDTAKHAILECPHWAESRNGVAAYLGGRDISPSDIQDILCGPADLQTMANDTNRHARLTEAAHRCTQSFYDLVEEIMTEREQRERDREAAARARRNAVQQAP